MALANRALAPLAEGGGRHRRVRRGDRSDKTHGGGHVFALETGDSVAARATDGTFYSHNSLLAGLENDLQVAPPEACASTATLAEIANGRSRAGPDRDRGSRRAQGGVRRQHQHMNRTETFSVTRARALRSWTTQPSWPPSRPRQRPGPKWRLRGKLQPSSTAFTVDPSSRTTQLSIQHAVSHGPGTARPTVSWPQADEAGESAHQPQPCNGPAAEARSTPGWVPTGR